MQAGMEVPDNPEKKSESKRHAHHEDSEYTTDTCPSEETEKAYHGLNPTYTHSTKQEEKQRRKDSDNKRRDEYLKGAGNEAGIEESSAQEKEEARLLRQHELEKRVMVWLSRGGKDWKADRWENRVHAMQDYRLCVLKLPEAAVNMVYNDRCIVVTRQRVARQHNRDDDHSAIPSGHRVPSKDRAMAHNWEPILLNGSFSNIYNWYKLFQATCVGFGIPVMPFEGVVLEEGGPGLCIPGMGTALHIQQMWGNVVPDSVGVCCG